MVCVVFVSFFFLLKNKTFVVFVVQFIQISNFSTISVLQTCGGIVRENSTYFVNPNHPDTYDGTGSCQVTVQKLHPDICQLR